MGVASRGSHGLGGLNGKGLTGRIELAIQGSDNKEDNNRNSL